MTLCMSKPVNYADKPYLVMAMNLLGVNYMYMNFLSYQCVK